MYQNLWPVRQNLILAIVLLLPVISWAQDINPCPTGMTLIRMASTTTDSSASTGHTQVKFYKAWPWEDCETGQLITKPRKRHTETDSLFYFFRYEKDTIFCLTTVKVEKEIECLVQNDTIIRDTIDRTPKRPDTAWIVPRIYPLIAATKSKLKFEFGGGGRLTQFWGTRQDSIAPWIQRMLQGTVGVEGSMSIYRPDGPNTVTCEECGSFVPLQKEKRKIGFNSRIFLLLDVRGKHVTTKVRKSEFRGYTGVIYYISEVHENRTVNRGLDGIEFVAGFGGIRLISKTLSGVEIDFRMGYRPFPDEIHTSLVFRALIGR